MISTWSSSLFPHTTEGHNLGVGFLLLGWLPFFTFLPWAAVSAAPCYWSARRTTKVQRGKSSISWLQVSCWQHAEEEGGVGEMVISSRFICFLKLLTQHCLPSSNSQQEQKSLGHSSPKYSDSVNETRSAWQLPAGDQQDPLQKMTASFLLEFVSILHVRPPLSPQLES